MENKIVYAPCGKCVWNNRVKCGRTFCIFSRCVGGNGLLQKEKPWAHPPRYLPAGLTPASGPDHTAATLVPEGFTSGRGSEAVAPASRADGLAKSGSGPRPMATV